MKKLGIAFIMALLALAFVVVPVLADGGNAYVECDEITVTDDSPPVGTTITFYGNVTVVSNANSQTPWYGPGFGAVAYAESSAWYKITAPDGTFTYVSISPSPITDTDWGSYNPYTWTWSADADAGHTYTWEADVYVDQVGEYLAEQGGDAYAYYGHWEWDCYEGWVLVKDGEYGPTTGECPGLTVTSHAGVGMGMVASPPRLTIQLPAGLAVEKPLHAEVFFGSDGWGDPTSEFIAYSDGIWQVEIADGTVIMLDGEWQRYTWIEVDDQGNVTGRYGAGGHTVAEEIALSSPITITKVG
jgi:hypothetical protein